MKTRKKMGRPTHKPTSETRKQVETLSGMGIPYEQLCSLLGICDDTLRKYYQEELVSGKGKANAKIAQCLFNKATGGDTTALIFWAKTQMRWKETSGVELTGKDGAAVEINDVTQKLFDKLGK